MIRNEIYWADLGPVAGRRPVVVLTRDPAIAVLNAVTCAPITTTIRNIRSEVEVGSAEGLPVVSVINCDGLVTVPKGNLDQQPAGRLSLAKRAALDAALRYALDISY